MGRQVSRLVAGIDELSKRKCMAISCNSLCTILVRHDKSHEIEVIIWREWEMEMEENKKKNQSGNRKQKKYSFKVSNIFNQLFLNMMPGVILRLKTSLLVYNE